LYSQSNRGTTPIGWQNGCANIRDAPSGQILPGALQLFQSREAAGRGAAGRRAFAAGTGGITGAAACCMSATIVAASPLARQGRFLAQRLPEVMAAERSRTKRDAALNQTTSSHGREHARCVIIRLTFP
jgi:hypothetical protein